PPLHSFPTRRSSDLTRDLLDRFLYLVRYLVAAFSRVLQNCIGSAFADFETVQVYARHSRLRSEGNERRRMGSHLPPAQVKFLFQDRKSTRLNSSHVA